MEVDNELAIAEICLAYGWTLNEYLDHPLPFLKVVMQKYTIERKKQEANNK